MYLNFKISHFKKIVRHLSKLPLKMENISRVWLGPLPSDSPYVKPYRFHYVQNGVEKNWDLMKVHDSVLIVIYNKPRDMLVFVRQFRPAVYYGIVTADNSMDTNEIDVKRFPPNLGVTIELCAGIVDKDNKSWTDIAREEIIEECGYDVPVERIEEILIYRSGVGATGAEQRLYYCEVSDSDRVTDGGGVDDEIIEVVEHSVSEVRAMLQQGSTVNSPPNCIMGLLWFLLNKAPTQTS